MHYIMTEHNSRTQLSIDIFKKKLAKDRRRRRSRRGDDALRGLQALDRTELCATEVSVRIRRFLNFVWYPLGSHVVE